ncbi:hypothetical protein [Promicromonospora sp. NPDC019610]|uniref:hypothetical protein n=1 Tax=Promicromonospora sp. NPDC019610 TaxID=3364405 RepID=UPI00378CEC05
MRRRYLIAGGVSSAAYVFVGPLLTILSISAQSDATGPEEDLFPIGVVVGWILAGAPLTLAVVATALLGEVFARRVRKAARKLLAVSLVSAALVFGAATLLTTLTGASFLEWSLVSLTLLPGWLVAGAGPRLWWWIAELEAAVAKIDAEPDAAETDSRPVS